LQLNTWEGKLHLNKFTRKLACHSEIVSIRTNSGERDRPIANRPRLTKPPYVLTHSTRQATVLRRKTETEISQEKVT
jgi:hypothetical protein